MKKSIFLTAKIKLSLCDKFEASYISVLLLLFLASVRSYAQDVDQHFDPYTNSALDVHRACTAAYANGGHSYISWSSNPLQCGGGSEDGATFSYYSVLNAIYNNVATGESEGVALAWSSPCSSLMSWNLSDAYTKIGCNEYKFHPSLANNPNNGENCNNTENPINIYTGNKYYTSLNLSEKPKFFQSYNSMTGGWQFSYLQKLIIKQGNVIAHRSDGKTFSFVNNETEFEGLSQRFEKLVLNGQNYELILPNGTIEKYDLNGVLVSITNAYQELISVSYVGNEIIVEQGRNRLVLITENNRVVKVILPNESQINYTYLVNNGVKTLSSVTYSDNSTRHYFYDDSRFPTHITGVDDENGNRISSVQYDYLGRAISSEKGPLDSGIERTEVQYNNDVTHTVTNALKKQSTYHFAQFNDEYKTTKVQGHPSENCAAANTAYTYNQAGLLDSKTDWLGNKTVYTRNANGQESSRTEAFGTPQARTIQTEWHPDFAKPIKIIEPERTTEYTYDIHGRRLSSKVIPTP